VLSLRAGGVLAARWRPRRLLRIGVAVTLTGGAVLVVLTTGTALLCRDVRTLARTQPAPVV
jgi:ribosomal protein L5